MMKIIDISLPIFPGMTVWPGDTKFDRRENRGTAVVSKITMSSHTGTHIDAPKHFLFNNQTVDKIDLQKLVGKCLVIEIKFPSPGDGEGSRERSRPRKLIEISGLHPYKIHRGDRILFKTRNSRLLRLKKFTSDYVSLSLDVAKYLASKKISLVGTDYFGIEAKSAPGHPVHKALLRAGIVIIEGLDLSKVKPGKYNLAALPLRIKGGDGAPARVVLWK